MLLVFFHLFVWNVCEIPPPPPAPTPLGHPPQGPLQMSVLKVPANSQVVWRGWHLRPVAHGPWVGHCCVYSGTDPHMPLLQSQGVCRRSSTTPWATPMGCAARCPCAPAAPVHGPKLWFRSRLQLLLVHISHRDHITSLCGCANVHGLHRFLLPPHPRPMPPFWPSFAIVCHGPCGGGVGIHICCFALSYVVYICWTDISLIQRLRKHITIALAHAKDSRFHQLLRSTNLADWIIVPLEVVWNDWTAALAERYWWDRFRQWCLNDMPPGVPRTHEKPSKLTPKKVTELLRTLAAARADWDFPRVAALKKEIAAVSAEL